MENAEITIKNKLDTEYAVKGGAIGFEVKDVDMSKRTVSVVLNTMNFLDSDMDMLLPDCCKRSLKECGVNSTATAKIKYLKDHDMTKSIGKWMELSEKEIVYGGRAIKCLSGDVYLPYTPDGVADTQLINYQEKIIDNHSIGFQYENIFMVEKNAHGNSEQWKRLTEEMINPDAIVNLEYFFAVKEIRLFEGSSVAFGANSLTPYLGVKSGNKEGLKLKIFNRLDLLKSQLVNGKQNDECMRDFELQILQLKQILNESSEPLGLSEKEKAIEKNKVVPSLNIGEVAKSFSLKL